MKHATKVLIISFSLFTSCAQKKDKLPDSYIARFENNKAQFTKLITLLGQDTSFQHKLVESLSPNQFSDTVSQSLKSLKIDEVWLLAWRGDHRQLDFVTTWRRETPIHVYYNTYDSTTTKRGYYVKDENSNEIWGLGDNWSLWNEIKLRNAIR